ncbi:glycoside hydrolase family 43 protein [Pelomonas sp. P7]|uniref:Extracellular exo-alpha-(1->5)-L-arabinofuranosidase n=1 Tax=Pelomonas caseinilytica TaxID=2906763 RepID=A0ABS8XHU8_9BURK|nr:glycoside hydrolase family 43 protein [Pelomonas sp. P7]MCE4539315.1 glycoside hydrolase family 43 protein [Pelomonas sp. P7]
MFLTCKRLVRLAAAGLLAALLAPAGAAPWALSGAIGTHDPNIYKTSSTWWIFETTDNGGIGVKYSSDGHAWTQGLPIFSGGLSWWKTYLPAGKTAMVWAPGCGEYAGLGYCYYAISSFGSQKSAIGLTTSAGGIAASQWVDQGAALTSQSGDGYNAIDPSFVLAANGDPYLVFGSFWNGIHITRVSKVNLKPPTGGIVNIAKDSVNGIENGFVVKKAIGGTTYYYLFASKGACCKGANSTYYIVVGRSTSITGPYVDKAGVAMLSGGGTVLASSGTRFKGPGGQSLLADGSVMAWHAYDAQNNGAPVLFINNVTWGSDGWPQAVW